MLITRRIGAVLRGRATPLQLTLACLLGAWIGFVPGIGQAPGLLLAVLAALVVLNANLILAAMVAAVCKLISLAVMPASFALGRLLLDGPTQPMFEWAINAPVLALFGLEYYVVTGGLTLGTLAGLAAAMLLIRLLTGFRRRMASLDVDSPGFAALLARPWVRVLLFVFAGSGQSKAGYTRLLQRRLGNPIRPLGVVLVLLVAVLLGMVQMFASGPIATAMLRSGLERANGATVDLEQASVDFKAGSLTIQQLAMADPNDLDRDVLRARELVAKISGADLLRRRLTLDTVTIDDASHGQQRRAPGRLVGKSIPPAEPPAPAGEEKPLEYYLERAEELKERLAYIRRWLERLSGPERAEDPQQQRETLRDRLAQRAAELGYAHVQADHLIQGTPLLLINELNIKQLTLTQLEGETLNVQATHLSTHPHLVDRGPRIRVMSSSDTVHIDLAMHQASATAQPNQVTMRLKNLSVQRMVENLHASIRPTSAKGQYDLSIQGQWSPQALDLPLNVQVRDLSVQMRGQQVNLAQLPLTLQLRGPMDSPNIAVQADSLADSLLQAAGQELRQRADDLTQRATERAGQLLQQQLGQDQDEDSGSSLLDALRRQR